jgi:Do/DeqQ family serine protease
MRTFLFFMTLLTVAAPAHAQTRVVPESTAQVQLSFAPIVKRVAPAVVNIYTKRVVNRTVSPFMNDPVFGQFFNAPAGGLTRQQVEQSLGSGVIVDPSGIVITNAHVVNGAAEIMVVLSDGREFEASPLVDDTASDIAVLQMKAGGINLPAARLHPTNDLQIGDVVLAIGNPFGVGQTVTSGIVSAMGKASLPINQYNYFIQTDAAINPGNSGGPLVDMTGGVVGINSAIFSKDGGSLGIGFAIPSEMVQSVLNAQKSGLTSRSGAVVRGWFGMATQDVTADIANSLGISPPRGAIIQSLHPQSPMKAAGIQAGDVIVKMNGQDVKDATELRFRTATLPVGSELKYVVLRKGQVLDYTVHTIAPPEVPKRNTTTISGENPLEGAVVMNINPAVSAELSLPYNITEGVAVSGVSDKGFGARFLKSGDIILAVNGQKITDVGDVIRALKYKGSSGFSITTNRAGRTSTLVIR